MDKSTLLHAIASKGLENTFSKTPEWVSAFEAYKKATGDNQVSFDCGTCYRTVLKWLKA